MSLQRFRAGLLAMAAVFALGPSWPVLAQLDADEPAEASELEAGDEDESEPASEAAEARAETELAPPPGPDAPEETRRQYWRERARAARQAVAAARERVAVAEEAYQDFRQRRYPRGAAAGAIAREREDARAALEAALTYQEEGLWEDARRAGALPGWIRLDDAAASPTYE